MRNLLVTVLLAVFALQATVVAVGDHLAKRSTVEHMQLLASDAAPGLDTSADDGGLELPSNAIEELSDYLPAELVIPRSRVTPPSSAAPELRHASIDLPRLEPPPRA